MNLKNNILYILVSTVLCLSIIAYPKSVYAYEDAWDELQKKVNESLGNYNQDKSDEEVYFKSTQSGAITTITLTKDIEATGSNHNAIVFNGARSYVLNLNNHKLNVNNTDPKYNGYAIDVVDGVSLTIKNGTISGGNNTGNGGGIYCEGNLTLDSVKIENCKAQNGGGIYFIGNVKRNPFDLETLSYIYTDFNASQLVIDNCSATNNGGGIYGKSFLGLTNCYIQNSSAGENGGAIYLENDDKWDANVPDKCSRVEMVTGSIFDNISGCSAKNGSAIYVEENAVCTLANGVKIKNNTATQKGTIYSEGVLGIDTATITDNKAENGGGIYLKGNAFLGGNANIIDNENNNGKNNNLVLSTGGNIFFGNDTDVPSPSSSMKIGITLENMQNINISTNGSADYASYLVSDENYPISFNGTNFILGTIEAPRTSSKKYKVIYDKTMIDKITGSGKKGSKRTIYPLENEEVESISLVDKNDEDIEVTKEEDGTYTFIQPKSNVTLDITYKQNEIVLNLDSNVAKLNGKKVTLDVKPLVRNNRTMLPIRFIAESLGASVEWNALEANMIYITKGDTNIEIKLGSNIAKINGEEYELDSAAFAENNRTYLPVRFIAEALNADVIWDESNPNEVVIKLKI